MRVLLSTIGSRGDVQPVVALASELLKNGHQARVCAPPDFRELVEEHGMIEFVPIGPEVRQTAAVPRAQRAAITPEQIRQMMEGTVATQFATFPAASEGCDILVGCNGIQIALRSIAEHLGIPYVFTTYAATTLPSPDHAPPPRLGQPAPPELADYSALWAEDAQAWNAGWRAALNTHRKSLDLPPVDDVRTHVFTNHPWLAADPILSPWNPAVPESVSEPELEARSGPKPRAGKGAVEPRAEAVAGPEPAPGSEQGLGSGLDVFQTGAWLLPDERPLEPGLEGFLRAGEPPVYFGFGSVAAPDAEIAQVMLASARAVGRRAIVSRGWAELSLTDEQADWYSVGEVNQQALFQRVAAVVHHGGAGTTTAAARAGASQLVLPQHYDQHYFARRVNDLGIGVAHAPEAPTVESLIAALDRALQPEIRTRAEELGPQLRADGTTVAVRALRATVRSPGR